MNTQIDFSDFKKVIDDLVARTNEKDEEWKLTIYRETNCYILEGMIDDITRRWSIEDDENDELKSHESLLREVMEYFGFPDSPERLRVIREKKEG